MKDRERDQEANVVDTAVQVLGVVAQRLEWPQYQELLGMFNRAMQRTEGKVRQRSPAHSRCGSTQLLRAGPSMVLQDLLRTCNCSVLCLLCRGLSEAKSGQLAMLS